MTLAAFQEQFSFKFLPKNSYKKVLVISVQGNEFQTVGPHTGKARGPEVIVLVRGTVNSRCAAERE